jgi:hypothetical protein
MKKLAGYEGLKKHLRGEFLERKEAMLAKCYECMGGYDDGAMDCEVLECPMYDYMPFATKPKKRRLTRGQKDHIENLAKKNKGNKYRKQAK